jgi:hypothetical protein
MTTGRAVAIVLVAMDAAAIATRYSFSSSRHAIVLVLICLPVITWAVLAGRFASHGGWSGLVARRGIDIERVAEEAGAAGHATECVITTAAAMTPAALALYASLTLGGRAGIVVAYPLLMRALLIAAIGGLTGVVLSCVIAGVMRGVKKIDRDVTFPFSPPRTPAPVPWRVDRPAKRNVTDPITRIAEAVTRFAFSMADGVVRGGAAIVNVARRAVYLLACALFYTFAWIHKHVTLAIRRLASSLRAALKSFEEAVSIGAPSFGRATRVVLVPFAALAASAFLLTPAAVDLRAYLLGGSVGALGLFAGRVAGVTLLATLAWVALCALPLSRSIASARRSLNVSVPNGLVLLAAGGWVVGLPGTLGYGRIHVGILTIGSTILVIAAYVWSRFSEGAPASSAETLGEEAQPAGKTVVELSDSAPPVVGEQTVT